jgi:hypothetical protein
MNNTIRPDEERRGQIPQQMREQAGIDERMIEQLVRGEQTARERLSEEVTK